MRRRPGLTLALFLIVPTWVSCSSSSDGGGMLPGPQTPAEWVDDAMLALTETMVDSQDDYDFSEPPYSQPVDYAPVDVRSLSYGFDGTYVYIRVDLDGTIPSGPHEIAAEGEVEAQTVTDQSFSVVLDTDNNDVTGAGASNFQGTGGLQGADIFFGFSLRYGGPPDAYAHWDFSGGDIHFPAGQVEGEVGAGGPGSDFFLVRYDVSGIDPFYFPRGTTVEIGGWSEAESDLYHEFCNDFLTTGSWAIPD